MGCLRIVRRRGGAVALAAVALASSATAGRASGVRIAVPASGARLTGPTILVQGEAPRGAGVSVNGNPALMEGDRFVALLAAEPGLKVITVTARDYSRELGTESIRVSLDTSTPDESALRLRSRPTAGAPPLTVRFELSSALVTLRNFSLDADGDGRPDAQGSGPFTGATFTYASAGIYAATVTGMDLGGTRRSALTVVQVSDPVDLDARMQFVWSSFKTALRSGSVARAVEFLHSDTRDKYRQQFDRMSPADLAAIDQILTTIRLVEIGFGGAQYEMLARRDGQTLSYAVWFQLDRDGLWRLRGF